MKISTRGRYALRIMVDLAEKSDGKYVPLKDIVERQGVSLKYAESVMLLLSKKSLIDAERGKGGGYKLNKPAEYYTVGEILRATEGDLGAVECLSFGGCERAADCRTLPLWKEFNACVNAFFDGKTLADLCRRDF
ncbi:MAG TPA: Rrf2 family transcriptional regulator [Clostridiales bacterium]|nr:Rrf2 family transcriptional regulator [Clostridiales bacterium]